jgi:hypothetical protein
LYPTCQIPTEAQRNEQKREQDMDMNERQNIMKRNNMNKTMEIMGRRRI